jgi:hypothetical protein
MSHIRPALNPWPHIEQGFLFLNIPQYTNLLVAGVNQSLKVGVQ